MKSAKRLNDLLRRKMFPDFLKAMNNHVDTKEWVECMCMFNIARKILMKKDYDIILDVGCGKRPTLGTIMALSYKKPVICIDPQLDKSYAKNINNILLLPMKLSETEMPIAGRSVLVLCNHSHVSKEEITFFLSRQRKWCYATCPCCIDNKLKQGEYVKDIHNWSPKNETFIFYGESRKEPEGEKDGRNN